MGRFLPEAVAEYVAHVPEVYQVPALIKHPVWLPLVTAFKYPLPEKVPPPPVGLEPALVVVVVGAGLPDFGRYLIPVEEQLEVEPTGEVGTNVPV